MFLRQGIWLEIIRFFFLQKCLQKSTIIDSMILCEYKIKQRKVVESMSKRKIIYMIITMLLSVGCFTSYGDVKASGESVYNIDVRHLFLSS